MQVSRSPGDPGQTLGRLTAGQILVSIDRGDYWQVAYVVPKDTADEWNKLDDYVVNQKAYVLPYGNEESTSFFSERMNAKDCSGLHPVYKNDWLQFCQK